MSRYVELIDSDSFYSNSNNDEENEPAGSITADHDTDEYYCNPCGPADKRCPRNRLGTKCVYTNWPPHVPGIQFVR